MMLGHLRQVRATHRGVIGMSEEEVGYALQPVAVGFAVVVGVGEKLVLGLLRAGVARGAQAAGFDLHQMHFGEAFANVIRGVVAGAIVDHHDFYLVTAHG